MAKRLDILINTPSIGPATAFTLLIDMPGLGTLDNKQAASLAGLAAIGHVEGQGAHPRWEGNPALRNLHAGPRRHPDIKRKYQQLIANGKPPKLAITACIGKTVPQTVF